MFKFRNKDRIKHEKELADKAKKSTDFAIFNAVSGSQRSSYGDRGEMVSGVMNNNQKLATLQMMRNMRDAD